MGYALTYNSFQRVREHLDVLKRSEHTVQWNVKDTKKFVYKLHAGLKAAAVLKVPGYDHLKDIWMIKTNEAEGKVFATIKANELVMPALVIQGAVGAFQIVTKMIGLKGTQDKVIFVDVELGPVEETMVTKWCDANHFTFTREGDSIVIQKSTESRAENF